MTPSNKKPAPARRSAEANALRDPRNRQRVIPDKRQLARTKAQEIDIAWEQHARDIERGDA